jgi:hypothetical protein
MARAGSGLAPAYDPENMVERAVQAMRDAPMQPQGSHTLPSEADRPLGAVPPSAVVAFHVEAPHPTPAPIEIAPTAPMAAEAPPGPAPRIEPVMAPVPQSATEEILDARVAWQPAAELEDFTAPARPDGLAGEHIEPMLEHPASNDDLVLHANRDDDAEPEVGYASPTPSFVRQADRAARWRSPKVAAVMATLCLLGVLGLLAQFAHEYRDVVAARFEPSRPLLERACGLLQCSVSAPRMLDAEGVSVESSGLVRVEKTNTYRLSVALRNRAATVVAMPALELSLTDAQGKLMVRRVLRAADFGVTQNTVAAGRELSLQATMQTAFANLTNAATDTPQEAVAGYTIELFYP